MIATREADRSKSFAFEKVAKKNVLEKAKKAAAANGANTAHLRDQILLDSQTTEDDNMSYTQRSANRLNCRRIASAVRIVDFVVRDYLYLAAESCLSSFLTKFKMLRCGDVEYGDIGLQMVIRDLRKNEGGSDLNDDDSHGEEEVDLNLLSLYGIDTTFPPPHKNELELELYPNKRKALNKFLELVTEIFDACRHETSLLHHDMLKDIFRPIANELVDCTILDLIYFDEQNSIHTLSHQIANILEQDMTKCERTLKEYSFLLETYCRTSNEANSLTVDILNKFTIAEITTKLNDIQKEITEISSLPSHIRVGIATLNIRDAVEAVLGQVEHILAAYYKTIPQLFVVLGEKLYQRVHSVKVVLIKQFTHVKDYVEAIEVFNQSIEDVPEVEQSFEYLVGLKKIITSNKIPTTDEMFGIDTTLKTEYQKYQESLSNFEEAMEDTSKHFQKELLSRSKTVIVPIEEIELSLASDVYGSPDSDADEVIQSVLKLEAKFEDACDESTYLVKCQHLMKFFVFDGIQVDRIQQQFKLNKIVWKAVKIIRHLILYIMDTHFQDVDCLPVQLKVQAISKALSKLEEHDASDVEVWVDESITLLDALLPVIVQLQSDSYTTEQMAEIETLLNRKIYSSEESPVCSGQTLVGLKALEIAPDIQTIYHRNVCECNLQQKLQDMQTSLNKKEVQIAQDRDISYRISNLLECSNFLEDLVITTKVSLQSEFVKLVKDEYSLFFEKVQGYDQLIKWIIVFQEEGLRLRTFYTNPKITRHVHQGFKYFNIVDESWRSLIKLARSDNLLLSLLSSSRLKNLEIINNALTIAYDVVYTYLESQRVNSPRLYFLSDTQCFDMFCNADMKTIFELSGTTLFPNISSITLGADGDNVFVEGVQSGTETIRFKSVCPLKIVLGDWINEIDKTLMEHVIADVRTLVTDERSIIEDARYPICSNQAKIVGLEVKFWTTLKETFRLSSNKARHEMQRAQSTSILDNIVILGTISSMSKDSYQVQSVATMLICLIQQRDLFQKTFRIGGSTVEGSSHFDEYAFFLECAIQKFYDRKTSEITVRHFTTELSYGYKYLGFSRPQASLVVTPLTEKCYLSISATFQRTSQHIPFLRGSKYGSQLETLASVTNAFGLELFPINCALIDYTATETTIKRSILGVVGGKFHVCFTNIEALNSTSYSVLINSLTTTLKQLSEKAKEKPTKTKFDLFQAIHMSRNPHFSMCLGINHTSEATYFPASIRKRFRPLHIISPRFSDVLGTYLEAYGFETPAVACVRLSGFLDHLSVSCTIDHSLLLKILIQEVIPLVGNSLIKSDSVDMSQQCYLVVKYLFTHIPSHMQEFLNTRTIQYACSFYLNIYFDPVTNLADFKEEQSSSSCDKLIDALKSKQCAIVIGGVDCGKTSIIREAVGQIEGFGSKKNEVRASSVPEADSEAMHENTSGVMIEGSTIDNDSSIDLAESSTRSLSMLELGVNGHGLVSRNGLYDFENSYPKRLFRHQINPLLFNNIDIEANNLVNKVTWSGVSTCVSPAVTTDMRRALILEGNNNNEAENVESKINNKRHFDSLDRFLYDISSKDDISYLHMDINDSSMLSHYMNRLTHNSPNKYSPSLTSMGFKLIWECEEIGQLDPGLASSVPIICLSESTYTPEDTLSLQMQYFIKKFDYQPTNEELSRGITTPLVGCLSTCVDIFVQPFLNPKTFASLKSIQSVHVVIRSFFEIASAMYRYVGLDISTLVHPQLITVVYDSTHKENSVIEKQLWNQVTFYSIMAFASIWSFGNCSPFAQEAYEVIYCTINDFLTGEVNEWSADVISPVEGNNWVLPPTFLGDGEECFPYYEYCLHRVDSDDVVMRWVHWKQLTPLAKQSLSSRGFDNEAHIRRNTDNFYCTVNDYYQETFFVPTHLSVVSILLKDALIRDTHAAALPASTIKSQPSGLAIIGNTGVGKSSLLYMLANSMDARKHWKGIIEDCSPHKVQRAIGLAKDMYQCYLLENNLPFVGAFFIDDVNIDHDAASNVDRYGAEFYRTLFSGEHYYDPKQRKWLQMDNIMYAFSATIRGNSTLNQRLLQHCIAFSVSESGESVADIFCAKFLAMCPSVKEDVAFDIANITFKLFDQFRVATLIDCPTLPMIKACPASRQVKFVFSGIAKAFENHPVVSSLEVCKQWKRIVVNVTNGSFVDKSFAGMIENLLDNTSSHRSNIKGIIYKGQGDTGGGTKKILSVETKSTCSFRHTLKKTGGAKSKTEEKENLPSTSLKSSVYNSMILMDHEEIISTCLPLIQQIHFEHFQLLDFENPLLWKDIQKCVGFLTLGDAPYALFWGPAKPVLSVMVASSCFITKWSYIPFTMDGRKALKDFTLQYVRSFCYFLFVAHENDLKLNNKFVDTVRRNMHDASFEDGAKIFPESMLKLWHIYLNDINTEITSDFWLQFRHIFQFKTEEIHNILWDVYNISFKKNTNLQKYIMQFMSHVKVVFSFGPNVDATTSVRELSYVPKLSNKMQNFHFSTVFRMNKSLLLNAFENDQASELLSAAVAAVVSEVAEHSMLQNCFFLELIRNSDYEEGTYAMISYIFQLSIDPTTASVWDRYTDEFVKLLKLTESFEDRDDNTEEKTDSLGMENLTKQKMKLIDITWACVSSRFLSVCDTSQREELEMAILDDMKSNDIPPNERDIRVVAYAYMHTLVETGHMTLPQGFVEMFDTILLCGSCIPSMRDEYCSILLTLLSFGAVRVIGSSHYVIRLLVELCGVDVREDAFNIKHCDSFNLEDIVSVSEDQTQILFADDHFQNATHTFTQSVVSLPTTSGTLGGGDHTVTSGRTSVLVFNLENVVCVDAYIFYFLMKGFTHNQKLFEAFAHFRGVAALMASSSGAGSATPRSEVLGKICDDAAVHATQCETLRTQWTNNSESMREMCQGFAALSASVALFHPLVFKGMPDLLLSFLKEMSFEQKSSPMKSTIQSLLNRYYESLSEQLNESILLVLKINMVIMLTEFDHRISNSVLKQIFYMLSKRQGLLGLHPSPAYNDDIIPTTASFDVMNMLFAYLNQIQNPAASSSRERMKMDDLTQLFLDYTDSFEEWANMYFNDHYVIPLPDEVLDGLSYIERLVIVAVLKPVALNAVVSDGILHLSKWDVSLVVCCKDQSSLLNTPNSLQEADEHDNGYDTAAIHLCQNPSGAFDLSMTNIIPHSTPHYFNHMYLTAREGSIHRSNASLSGVGEHIIHTSESDRTLEGIIQHLLQRTSLCDENIVESACSALACTTAQMKKSNVIVKKMNTLSLMWCNFPLLLKHTLESLIKYHNDHASSVNSTMNMSIPKSLVRVYWLLAMFHVSVVIRLQPFFVTVGDDVLQYASRLLMLLRLRSVHEPELLFSKLNTLIYQVYHQVYDITADSVYVKSIIRALFENIFTEDSTDPDADYYVLGLLPLPPTLDVTIIGHFIEDIDTILSGGDCVHIADFIGCTNGELYEVHLKNITLSALQRCHNSSFIEVATNQNQLGRGHITSSAMTLSSPYLMTQPLLINHHHRITNAISFLLKELPPLIKINDDDDEDAMMKSLCAIQPGTRKRQSIAYVLKKEDLSGPNSPRKTDETGGNKGENHLWFYLQLEIESFNTALVALERVLTSMLTCQSCPSSVIHVIEELEQQNVPSAWLKYSFDEEKNKKVPLRVWIRQLFVRRKMLNVWLTQRYPEYIYLHLLHNPDGFMYALKQSFAESQKKSFQDVIIDARILTLPYTSLERHNEIAKINMGNMKPGSQSYSIVIAGAHLMNARWLEEQYNLEFLNPSFASKFSQELYVKVSATCEDNYEEDDFHCPVYTAPDFPTADSIETVKTTTMLRSEHRTPLFFVSIPTECSLIEWKKRNVTMHASPEWHVPDV
jgi:hypothetical protein